MPITNFNVQPPAGSLNAAYRPVVFIVEATATGGTPLPPFVACDVYVNGIYYKSIIRTAPQSTDSLKSTFVFDIGDALQEVLAPDIPVITNNQLLTAPHMSCYVFCRFRASDINGDGFTVEEGAVPVQGTKTTAPVGGGGTQSNTFFVINASLQHEDNQDLATHLNAYKQGTWANVAFPLTHRKKYFFCDNSSDHFPLLYAGDCIQTDIVLNYRVKGSSAFLQATAVDLNPCNPITFSLAVVATNRVEISLTNPLAAGRRAFVRYKLQSDTVWTDVGFFTAQNFFFNVYLAGDYDIQVIQFCSDCINSTATAGVFTIVTSTNLAWRPVDPFCLLNDLGAVVYGQLELYNENTDEVFYPDDIAPTDHTVTQTADLKVKFFSDPTFLTPYSLTHSPVYIFVKKKAEVTTHQPSGDSYYENEFIDVYTISAAGTEAFLDNVNTDELNETFSTYPTILSSVHAIKTYSLFPSELLDQGNAGTKGYNTLQQYNILTGIATGVTKPNDISDPDYVAPVSDATSCPVGPAQTIVLYGPKLEVAKLEFHYGGTFDYAPTASDTTLGSYVYVMPLPRSIDTQVTVKAKSLNLVNPGYVNVSVEWIDITGATIISIFTVTNNIETLLPLMFRNINGVYIQNA